jgi:intein-encoded DNA endonuclease-like protein
MSCIPVSIPKNELKDLYEKKKLTTYEIADIYNCCQGTIWKRLKEYGIKRLPNGRRSLIISKSKLKDLYVKQRLSSRRIAKIYGCAYSAIDYKIREYGFPVKTLAAAHITTLRKNFDGNKTDKAYLIGFAMGDLRIRKKYPNSETINVDCGSTKKAQINLILELFKPYGRIWVSKPNRKGATQIECSLNDSFIFLLKKRTSIDPWILKNKRYFWAFLAGFTDAEGCISISKRNQAYYSLGNYNKNLLSQVREYLIRNKIRCPKLTESKTKGKLCFGKYFHNQNYWHLRVSAKDSLLTLFKFIGPYLKHLQKRKDMEMAKQNIIVRNR